VTGDFRGQFCFRPWIKLFQKDNANVTVLALGPLYAELVTNFAGAEQKTLDLLYFRFRQNILEAR